MYEERKRNDHRITQSFLEPKDARECREGRGAVRFRGGRPTSGRTLTALQELDSYEHALREAEPSALDRIQRQHPEVFDPERRERGAVDPVQLRLVLDRLFEELVHASVDDLLWLDDEAAFGVSLMGEEEQFH